MPTKTKRAPPRRDAKKTKPDPSSNGAQRQTAIPLTLEERDELAHLRTFERGIAESQQHADASKTAWEDSRVVAREKKASWEKDVERMMKIIRASQEHLPLIDGPKPKKPAPAKPAVDSRDWRAVTLSELGLSAKLVAKFVCHRDPAMTTVGDLTDFKDAGGKVNAFLTGRELDELNATSDTFYAKHPELKPHSNSDVPPGTTSTTTPGGIQAQGQADANSVPPTIPMSSRSKEPQPA